MIFDQENEGALGFQPEPLCHADIAKRERQASCGTDFGLVLEHEGIQSK
jgi:hypothetical protein